MCQKQNIWIISLKLFESLHDVLLPVHQVPHVSQEPHPPVLHLSTGPLVQFGEQMVLWSDGVYLYHGIQGIQAALRSIFLILAELQGTAYLQGVVVRRYIRACWVLFADHIRLSGSFQAVSDGLRYVLLVLVICWVGFRAHTLKGDDDSAFPLDGFIGVVFAGYV